MKRLYPILAVLALAACTGPKASENTVRNETYRIYEGVAPGSESWDWQEYTYTDEKGDSYFTNITTPELIASELQMSKKTFKKAIGALYKQQRISLLADGIQLLDGEGE